MYFPEMCGLILAVFINTDSRERKGRSASCPVWLLTCQTARSHAGAQTRELHNNSTHKMVVSSASDTPDGFCRGTCPEGDAGTSQRMGLGESRRKGGSFPGEEGAVAHMSPCVRTQG